VFEDAVTGKLAPGEHGWNQEHKAYNKALDNLLQAYLRQSGIAAEEMTPEQARDFLSRVRSSNNPKIRRFNERLRP
jgi:hypothetical protein